jgi:hypothetical protein
MTPDEAMDAVGRRARVIARDGRGGVYGSGRIISYSMVPTVTIEREDGSRIEWRYDMVEEGQ